MDKDHTWTTRNTKKGMIFMLLVLAAILLIISIDYVLGNKILDAITEYIEHICSKLYNKNSTDVNQMSDIDNEKKETTKFFIRPKFFGEKEYFLPIQGSLQVTTPSFNVPIPFNTSVNILTMVGLNKERWIVDWKSGFELNIRNQKIDISDICTIDAANRTLLFLIGDNKFILNVDFDSGKTIIKTNSKEFESEFAVLSFRAKHIETPKNYYGKATLELARMAQKKLEESENNKIGDDNV